MGWARDGKSKDPYSLSRATATSGNSLLSLAGSRVVIPSEVELPAFGQFREVEESSFLAPANAIRMFLGAGSAAERRKIIAHGVSRGYKATQD